MDGRANARPGMRPISATSDTHIAAETHTDGHTDRQTEAAEHTDKARETERQRDKQNSQTDRETE
jgi:hypothetical protein|eukprot:COSAG03_NODE_5638_length_1204_cov_3.692308_2_plen_65_part_00